MYQYVEVKLECSRGCRRTDTRFIPIITSCVRIYRAVALAATAVDRLFECTCADRQETHTRAQHSRQSVMTLGAHSEQTTVRHMEQAIQPFVHA